MNIYTTPINSSPLSKGITSDKFPPSTMMRADAIPRVSGSACETDCIHAGKIATGMFAPENKSNEKKTVLFTNITLRVIRLRHPKNNPIPDVLIVVIKITSAVAIGSAFDKSSPSNSTPNINPNITPNIPLIT